MASLTSKDHEVHFKTPVPKGYVFVRKGDVYVTRHCSQQTKDSGAPLYIVLDAKSHRIGIRVPHAIHASVTTAAALTASSRHTAVLARDARTLATARTALLRLFPAIPTAAAEAVVTRAFEKASGRVGRAGTIELDERIKRAVGAHVRHAETEYETLLREGVARKEARGRVARVVERKVREWRGNGVGAVVAVGKPSPRKSSLRGSKKVEVIDLCSDEDEDEYKDKDEDEIVRVVSPSPRKLSLRGGKKVEMVEIVATDEKEDGFPEPLREGFALHRRHTGHERKVFMKMQEGKKKKKVGAKPAKAKAKARAKKPGRRGGRGGKK